jgi:acyl-CoA synthetase (AMP-forming)/AMP-acid ligase II
MTSGPQSAGEVLAALPERIGALARRWATDAPDARALSDHGVVLSYRQLVDAFAAVAQVLRGHGVRTGDRVMIVGENCLAQVVLLLAAAELDAWFVVVNARLSAREIDAIRENCGARRVLYTVGASVDARAHAERHGATPIDLGVAGQVGLGPLNADTQAEPVHAGGEKQVAALVYTTGTTGDPKGVMLTHRNLLFVATHSARLRRLGPGDCAYGVLPISHVFGLTSVLLGTLGAGACLALEARYTPERLADALARQGISMLQGVPAMYARLLEWIDAGGKLAAPHLRFMYAGGSPLDATLKARAEALFGLTLHNGYGLTESAPTVCHTRVEEPRSDCSVGTPLPGVEVRLVAPGGGAAKPGEPGELQVRGPNVMLGYYRNPELTRGVLADDGWLDTGDLARQDPDGALFIVGRTRELIIRSGFNVYPVEVEAVLNSHPAVVQSAVVGREVPGNEEVVAFVEIAPGESVTPAMLLAFAGDRLAAYKRPCEIVIVASLPAAPTGKILKAKLREMAQQGRGAMPVR